MAITADDLRMLLGLLGENPELRRALKAALLDGEEVASQRFDRLDAALAALVETSAGRRRA